MEVDRTCSKRGRITDYSKGVLNAEEDKKENKKLGYRSLMIRLDRLSHL